MLVKDHKKHIDFARLFASISYKLAEIQRKITSENVDDHFRMRCCHFNGNKIHYSCDGMLYKNLHGKAIPCDDV